MHFEIKAIANNIIIILIDNNWTRAMVFEMGYICKFVLKWEVLNANYPAHSGL